MSSSPVLAHAGINGLLGAGMCNVMSEVLQGRKLRLRGGEKGEAQGHTAGTQITRMETQEFPMPGQSHCILGSCCHTGHREQVWSLGGKLRCCFSTGRFGDLCCGCLQLPGRQELPVAVHTLRDGYSDSQRLSFLAEALTLGQFDHSHIVRLEGVVTRGRPVWSCIVCCKRKGQVVVVVVGLQESWRRESRRGL